MTVLESTIQAVEQQVAEQRAVTDAAQQTRLAISFAERLELPTAFLAARELMERGEYLGQVVRDGQALARKAELDGLRRLVRGPTPIALNDVTNLVHEVDCWLDANLEQGRVARAVDMAMRAARMCREQAFQAAVAESSGFYAKLQRIARDVVGEVAKLKAPSRQVWGAPDVPGQMVREGRGDDWARMVMAQDRFSLVHQAGQLMRALGGLGAQGLLNGPPDVAFAYRRWDLYLVGEMELRRLHPGLRLRYAIEQKWEPGLWTRDDVPDKPAVELPVRRGLVGMLVGPRA